MAGLIRREAIDQVRERARIDEIVGEQVALRPAGVGALKGLCPFHDERTPSFLCVLPRAIITALDAVKVGT